MYRFSQRIENRGSPSPRHIPALSKQTGDFKNGFDGFESSSNSTQHCFKVRGDCSQLFFIMLKKYKYLIN